MEYILKVACADEKGLILRVSEVVFKFGLNFVDTSEFVDHENERFFMRAVVTDDCGAGGAGGAGGVNGSGAGNCGAGGVNGGGAGAKNETNGRGIATPLSAAHNDGAGGANSNLPASSGANGAENHGAHNGAGNRGASGANSNLHALAHATTHPAATTPAAKNHAAAHTQNPASDKLARELRNTLSAFLPSGAEIFVAPRRAQRIVILATKESHCLGDLLIRASSGEINAQILAVIANREDLRDLVERFGLPFVCVPSDGATREEHEAAVLAELARHEFDYAVLAKYMRILSADFVAHYPQRIINIHHSFLPAFIGANPYRQAFERGVKIIGATAHFVTSDLDEGPIITQNVAPVSHAMTWQQMRGVGRNVEKLVLSTALDLVFDERVFVYGNRTVVF